MEKLEVGDLILCTVDRIVGTEVFVKIDNYGEGGIVMSEIAPGRIRNLREYVVPKKRIVCKVLRISDSGNIDLSLRRVTMKERKEVIEKDKQEKSYTGILKGILGQDYEKTSEELSKQGGIFSFLESSKTNPDKLEKVIGKENARKVLEILNTQKKKKTTLKKEIHLTTIKPEGILLIKKVLETFQGINVKYISAGRYLLELESEDAKSADKKLKEMSDIAEKAAKKAGVDFSVK